MDHGLLLTSVHSADSDPRTQVAEHRDLLATARELGFEVVIAGQHYAAPALRYLQPVPWLASLAAEAAPMRVATGIVLLPLQHPLAMAEETATLDVLSDGRFIFGVGIGYAAKEFAAFGIDRTTRTGRFEEAIDLIRRLWAGDSVDHDGRFFRLDGVQASTRPLQPGGPPVWVGAQAEPSVRRAARLGDAWYCPPFPTHRHLAELHGHYVDECARVGREVPTEFPVRRELVIADTRAEARRLVESAARGRYETYADWGLDLGDGLSGAQWRDTRFLLGDPATIAEQLATLAEEVRMSHLVLKVQWPGWGHREARRQLERYGEDVLPLLA